MPKVKVYTTPTCVFCLPVKKLLEDRGVAYEEIDVSQNQEALEEIKDRTGQAGVPVTEIEGELVVGFDKEKIIALLDKISAGSE